MVSHLFFYQLVLVALVWLCVMLHWTWPSDPAAVCPTTPEPPGPRPKRRREPTPFAGLTQKPHCCPNPACASRGWVGWGNLRANGHPNGGSWRQLLCIACRCSFLETLGTLFHGKHVSVERIVRVIAC